MKRDDLDPARGCLLSFALGVAFAIAMWLIIF